MKQCLFCKKDTSESTSREHVVPESLGSYKLVLPKGIVCDSCNNYFARKVEKPILEHPSFRNMRGWYQVPNKKGNHPSVLGEIAGTETKINLKLNEKGNLTISLENSTKFNVHKNISLEANHFLFPISINPPKDLMSRLLAKMALEFLVYQNLYDSDWCKILAEEPHYDSIRNYARYNKGVSVWPFSQRTIYPMDALMRDPQSGDWVTAGIGNDLLITSRKETFFVFVYHGVEFVINTGGPSIKGYEEWLQQHGNISPFLERYGVKIVNKEKNGEIVTYIEGEHNLKNGIEFDRLHFTK
ncbi:HNH endonuclease [Belliella sp. R4-6]|uniref:HNH endonuclease n=1 Tax=Belliella alkalica TaxID=1730871 RepID=A0ABS9VBI0_9BACT|nr:HNH endonuclease [Belliella alkalica]MCH7413781.1 HNH endonuclease [Belliella alkalica]